MGLKAIVRPLGRPLKRALFNAYGLAMCGKPLDGGIVFLLGHMRSGSSLLSHILCSHPEIGGYGETHSNYDHEQAWERLRFNVHRRLGGSVAGRRFIFDKVLHSFYMHTHQALSDPSVRVIILIRDPVATLNSMIKAGFRPTPEACVDYYRKRLARLAEHAEHLAEDGSGRRAILVTYDDLIERPGPTLAALGAHLDLKSPLSEHYSTTEYTGKPGVGDVSENIHAGRIIDTGNRERPSILQPALRRSVDRAYRENFSRLIAACFRTVD